MECVEDIVINDRCFGDLWRVQISKLNVDLSLISLVSDSPLYKLIEAICFFEVNTKYISSSELKTSGRQHQNFHKCAARVKILTFSTHEMKYISGIHRKKSKFSFYFIICMVTILSLDSMPIN